MKIKINLSNRYLFLLSIIFIIIAGTITVYAFNSSGIGGIPSSMGHSVDEVNWSGVIQDPIRMNKDGLVIYDGNAPKWWIRQNSTYQFLQIIPYSSSVGWDMSHHVVVNSTGTVFTAGDVCTSLNGKCLSKTYTSVPTWHYYTKAIATVDCYWFCCDEGGVLDMPSWITGYWATGKGVTGAGVNTEQTCGWLLEGSKCYTDYVYGTLHCKAYY